MARGRAELGFVFPSECHPKSERLVPHRLAHRAQTLCRRWCASRHSRPDGRGNLNAREYCASFEPSRQYRRGRRDDDPELIEADQLAGRSVFGEIERTVHCPNCRGRTARPRVRPRGRATRDPKAGYLVPRTVAAAQSLSARVAGGSRSSPRCAARKPWNR